MSAQYAFFAHTLVDNPFAVYVFLSKAIGFYCDHAARICRTLSRHYYSKGKKVQLRQWNRALQYALFAAGWECYARPVGDRFQLVYAPTGDSMASAPRDLYAA